MNTFIKGREGENQAGLFLENNGFSIIHKNYRSRVGEIDIIAEKELSLVFVEVKKWGSIPLAEAGYSIDNSKKRKIILTAERYLTENTGKYRNYQMRFDLVFINSRNGEITHYENVFEGA